MKILKNEISLENKNQLLEYLNGFDYRESGLSFTSLYMWREMNSFQWEEIGEYLCIVGLSHLEIEEKQPFLMPPLTKTGTYDGEKLKQTLQIMRKRFEDAGYPFSLRLVPYHMADIFENAIPGGFKFISDRDNFDYLYLAKDLIELKGKDYHGKKNHLNFFKKNYQYQYEKMTEAMAEECMEFIREFNARKDISDHEMMLLKMEEEAMKDVFTHLDEAGYVGGVVRMDGKIQAISIGGRLGKKTITVHVEKANTEYRGLYQLINNEFCKQVAGGVKYLNREEDMGIPGLRKAKLSYNPVRMIEKYILLPCPKKNCSDSLPNIEETI